MKQDIYGPLDPAGAHKNVCESLRQAIDDLLTGKPLTSGAYKVGPADKLLIDAMIVMSVPTLRAASGDNAQSGARELFLFQRKVIQQLLVVSTEILLDPVYSQSQAYTDSRVQLEMTILTSIQTWLGACYAAQKGQENA